MMTSPRHSASQPSPREKSAVGSMSVPMATKKKIAKRSRNGSSRLPGLRGHGPSLIVRPATNAARASGMPARRRPGAGDREAGRDRDGEEQVRLGRAGWRGPAGAGTRRRATAAAKRHESEERHLDRLTRADGATRRMIAAPTPTTSWSTDQPMSRCSVPLLVVRCAAARDVDHDDARGHRDGEPEERRGLERQAEEQECGDGGAEGDGHLNRGGPEHRGVLAPELTEVDLDADLEEQQDRPDLGEQVDLAPVSDVARRKRRDGDSDGEIADDGRQRKTPGEPAGERRREQDCPDLEDGDRVVVHVRMVRGAEGI